MSLHTKFSEIAGLSIGEKSTVKLQKLGLSTPYDLFYYYPRKYEDFTEATPIEQLHQEIGFKSNNQQFFTVEGSLLGISTKKTRRRGFNVTEAVINDDTGSLKVVWFNQPYLAKMYRAGDRLILYGRVSYDRFSNGYVMESPMRAKNREITPVYSETAGMSSFFIGKLYSKIKHLVVEIEDWVPANILNKYNLIGLQEALLNIHEPEDLTSLQSAQRRLAFDELFLIALRGVLSKNHIAQQKAPVLQAEISDIKQLLASLPFVLTDDQKRATWQVYKDLQGNKPMHRLLNGDVGSGKTVVAAIAGYICAKAELRTLLMVPTEILAFQHFETFSGLFKSTGINIGLATSSRKENLEASILIGTQALIQSDFVAEKVGLVIVDEQHRFGVKQRESLKEKTDSLKVTPHFLSMTATPIPRTLHLALFGDLDISLIKEKPQNRKEIITRMVNDWQRESAYNFINGQIKKGRQTFVICPLIEEKNSSEQAGTQLVLDEERKTVVKEFEKLKQVFPDFRIAMVHGKLKSKDKEEIMADFTKGKYDILVSTSVVEVGVDIPNATVMLIEDAERFGLAQIHQFRGRVGRSDHQSYCFLFSQSQSAKALTRLRLLEKINDGFKLAEEDLAMRGPGAIFGTEQSGLLDLKMASISDRTLILEATEAANALAEEIESYPKISAKLKEQATKHLE